VATGVLRAAKIVWRHKFEEERPYQREFEGVQKFERISREHPSQLALFHIGRNDAEGYFYYVMELADDVTADVGRMTSAGEAYKDKRSNQSLHTPAAAYLPHTLRADLAHGRLPAARVLEIGLALAEALGHLHGHGLVHRWDRPEESRAQLTNSLNLRRSKAIIYRCIGHSYYAQRNYVQATNWYQKAIEIDGHHGQDFLFKGRAEWMLGDYVGSINAREKGDLLLDTNNPSAISNRYERLREAFDHGGPRGYWEQERRDSESYSWRLYEKAIVRIELQETNDAQRLLQESFAGKEGHGREVHSLQYLLFDECFDGLRDDPQFKELLTNMTFNAVMPARRK
jgi:tetratricopeptide (TPR) repeat protein